MNSENAALTEQPRFAEIGETTDSYNSPLGQQTAEREQDAAPEQPEENKDAISPQAGRQNTSRTPREAVERAMAKARQKPDSGAQPEKLGKKTEEPAKETSSPEVNEQKNEAGNPREKPQAGRQETATPQAGGQEDDPPRRFHDAARQEWNNTPQSVRAEVNRSLGELENGLAKYRLAHEKYQALRDYDEMATQHGTTLREALDNYSGIERLLHQDPFAALERIVANVAAHKQWRRADGSPVGFRDLAARYLNMPTDQAASRQDAVIARMNEQIAALASHAAQFDQAIEENRMRDTVAQIRDFAGNHPRLDELADDIAFLVESGRAADLRNAYELAERMNPAPQPLTQAQDLNAAQTRDEPRPANMAGQKSVSGAPLAGSDPRFAGKPSKTAREALLKALRKAQ